MSREEENEGEDGDGPDCEVGEAAGRGTEGRRTRFPGVLGWHGCAGRKGGCWDYICDIEVIEGFGVAVVRFVVCAAPFSYRVEEEAGDEVFAGSLCRLAVDLWLAHVRFVLGIGGVLLLLLERNVYRS